MSASNVEIIRVGTHPPDVRSDALESLFTTEKAGASYTRDPDLYARLRASAWRPLVSLQFSDGAVVAFRFIVRFIDHDYAAPLFCASSLARSFRRGSSSWS